eukprot:1696865-Amphidinium_carterae.1
MNCLKRFRQLFGYLEEHNNLALRMSPSNDGLAVYTDISLLRGWGERAMLFFCCSMAALLLLGGHTSNE